ncbi:hypothetical protein ES703_32718 [subsurface metagenome]
MVKDRESNASQGVYLIMGFIAAAAVAVAGFIITCAAAIAVMVSTVVAAVVAAASAAVAAISAIVATVTASVASVIGAIYHAVTTALMPTFSYLKTCAQVLYIGISDFVTTIGAGFKAFAEAIHLKTLLTIHNVAYMVSEDYRAVMDKIWSKIAEVSYHLGVGADFMVHAFRNARAIVLTTSGLLGRKYDLAEVSWLNQWNTFLKRMSVDTSKYTANPNLIMADIDKWLIADNVDAEGGAMQTVYTTIEDVILSVESTVETTVEIRNDLERFVSELPSSIQDRVRPMLDPVIEKFDGFYADTYRPKMDIVDGVMKEVGLTIQIQKDEIGDLIDRLKRPGDILVGIEGLPIPERDDQEEKITRASTVRFDRDRQAMMHDYIPKEAEFLKLREALKKKYPPPEYEVPEIEAPGRPAETPVEPRKTWNVGDY